MITAFLTFVTVAFFVSIVAAVAEGFAGTSAFA